MAAIVVAASAFGGFGAARPALAYDDQSTFTSVMGVVGVPIEENNDKIDYRERPKLVLPPIAEICRRRRRVATQGLATGRPTRRSRAAATPPRRPESPLRSRASTEIRRFRRAR